MGCFLYGDFARGETVQHLAPACAALGYGAPTAERRDNIVQAAPSSVVGDLELAGDAIDIAAILDQKLDEIELITTQVAQPAQREAAFERGVAAIAAQTLGVERPPQTGQVVGSGYMD